MRSSRLELGSSGLPAPVRAQGLAQTPRLTIDPTCEPQPSSDGTIITVTVHGYSFIIGKTVQLYWDGNLVQSPGDAIQVQSTGYIEATFNQTIFDTQSVTHTISAYYQDQPLDDSNTFPAQATTSLEVPCPTFNAQISLSPDCGPTGTSSIHVGGGGFLPEDPLSITVTGLSDGAVYGGLPAAAPADPNAISLDVPVSLSANGAYRVTAAQQYPPGVEGFDPLPMAIAYFVVPCSQLSVVANCGPSATGPNAYSIQVSGSAFVPDISVDIAFDAAGQPQYFHSDAPVNADGTFGPVEITALCQTRASDL